MRAVILTFIIILLSVAAYAQVDSSRQSASIDGRIEWMRGIVTADGIGIIQPSSDEPDRAKAFLKARGFAKMNAVVNLYKVIENAVIANGLSVKDISSDLDIKRRIEAYVRNVEIVDEKQEASAERSVVSITVQAPLFGNSGLTGLLLDSMTEMPKRPVKIIKDDKRLVNNYNDSTKPPYTGLIIDCAGLHIQRSLIPYIRKQDGSIIISINKNIFKIIREKGIVLYTESSAEAVKNPRIGSNPLLIKAIGIAGDKYLCDPVITDNNATKIITENNLSHFIEVSNIIIVTD